MMVENRKTSFLFAENTPYIEDLYESYLADRQSVSPQWQAYFAALGQLPAVDGSDRADVTHRAMIEQFAAQAKMPPSAARGSAAVSSRKQFAVQSLVAAFRQIGARRADLDPLRWSPSTPLAELTPAFYGLGDADLQTQFSNVDTYFSDAGTTSLKDLLGALKQTYCGTLAVETTYLADSAQRQWWKMRMESSKARPQLTDEQRRRILERLTAAEGLEKFIGNRYVGQKRFSLEGGESLIVLLDEVIRNGASHGLKTIVMGMAHRGRLNVLANTVGKPASELFDEFDGKTAHLLPAGDVKYHKGYRSTASTPDGEVEVVLSFNPSHLEFVNPVVQGITRGRAELHGAAGQKAVLPIEIHGDVAMSGQGIVMETMNLGQTKGHGNGGTLHIVINNQIGFTTSDPREARSTFFCTDIAKMIEAPVLHVNADDPEAVVAAVRMAIEFRTMFQRSVCIDLVCFRRHGHQEQDTPDITQPMMYRSITGHPGVRSIYAQQLVADALVSVQQVADYENAYRDYLATPVDPDSGAKDFPPPAPVPRPVLAKLDMDGMHALARGLTDIPDGYQLHPLVAKVITARREMASGAKPLDWGMAVHLAFATLLASKVLVRLSGEDSERGTFSHRHAVLNDQRRTVRGAGKYIPLQHVGPEQGVFAVNNSILSEAAVLAFEYGYACVRADSLVIWEAQFGDFANGAQVVIDNFIAAAASKWGMHNGLTMFLPHGQEGQGPEHASARLERYLQLCAEENIQVCQPTMPAQLFHLLRRQVTQTGRKPLVVMTPKSLLRHPSVVSSLEDLVTGQFQEVLADTGDAAADAAIEKMIVCSGKVYFDLAEYRRKQESGGVAVVRLEQLYPFPAAGLQAQLARYGALKKVVWCQEEPRNQGAWKIIEEDLRNLLPAGATLQDVTRAASASTATGFLSVHLEQQARLAAAAFAA
ncbi:MAG: 2-oxoglutarate dehydrogenase E1 component [Massilia sp.]